MKKLKGIVLAVILLLASIMMPFDVYADGLIVVNGSDYLLGINVDLYDSSLETYVNQAFITSNNGTSNYSQYTQTNVINQVEVGTYKYTFVFNKSYVGRIVLQYVVPNSQTTRQFTLFVNGTTAEYYSSRDNRYSSTSTFINNWTLSSAQLVEHDDIESLEQIVDLLTDIYTDTSDLVGASANQLDELQNIVANTSLANDYLKTLTKVRDFNVYFESYPFIIDTFRNNNFTYVDLANFYHLNYPIFSTLANTYITQYRVFRGNNAYVRIIFGTNIVFNRNNFTTYFNSNFDLVDLVELNNYANFRIYSLKLQNKTGSAVDFKLQTLNGINTFIPIYLNPEEYSNISTDFALLFGLSNRMLDDLDIIANGTIQSNSAASDLESGNNQMADDMNDLATIENGYNQQFNNQLQSIDFTSPIQNNAGILPAANFVITIFNGLINNNPFSVLIIVVCILLIGKKVIGK